MISHSVAARGAKEFFISTAPTSTVATASAERKAAFRMLRMAIVGILGLAVVIVLPVYRREAQSLRGDRNTLNVIQTALEEHLDKHPVPPLAFTLESKTASARFREAYYYNRFFDRQASTQSDAVVACLRSPLMALFKADGRHVLMYDGAEFEIAWYNEADFQKLANKYSLDLKPPTTRKRQTKQRDP